MIGIGIDSVNGKASSPINGAFSLYKQTFRYDPGYPARPMLIMGNGTFDVIDPGPNKLGSLIAKCTMLECYLYRNADYGDESRAPADEKERQKQLYHHFIKNVCDYIDKYVTKNMMIGSGIAMASKDQLSDDVAIESENIVPTDNMVMYMNRNKLTFGADKLWWENFCSELQRYITNLLATFRPEPKLGTIGLGFVSGGSREKGSFKTDGSLKWKLKRRPTTLIRVQDRDILSVERTDRDYQPREARNQAPYMYLLAYALREMVGEDAIENYSIHDWVAYATTWLLGIVGIGETGSIRHYSSMDNQVTLDHSIGVGYTMANRYHWGLSKEGISIDDWKKYLKLGLILGFATSRIKVISGEYVVKKGIKADKDTWDRFKDVIRPNFEKFGNYSSINFLMPRTVMAFNDDADLPIPCIVDEDIPAGMSEKEQIKFCNDYRRIRNWKPINFEEATIQKGEFAANYIDMTQDQIRYVKIKPMNDAVIYELDTINRQLIKWEFDISNIVVNGIDQRRRKLFWMFGLLANGESVPMNGYIIDASVSLFNPIRVHYYLTEMYEPGVTKNVTNTVGEQIPKPAGPLTPVNDSVDGSRLDASPSKAEKVISAPKVVEKSGGGVSEEKTTVEPSEGGTPGGNEGKHS